jgi:cobalt-zinc-cadmium resistance protein CzcA
VQDWIVTRRLFTVPGVVAVNSWGGTTKQYQVEVDLHKLDAYNITIPQIITALGNANINVGGREITVGQQSVNIRGIGLFDSGGGSDLTQGWRVNDIENVVLTQSNGVPVQIKDVAKVAVGYVPRLGIAGKDHDDDVALAIVVMGRTYHANDVIPLIKSKIQQLNTDGSLPPGVKVVPYYDRASLISVTSETVLRNLIYGCGLVFVIQWMFLGNLRSAIIVGANIPFALFFAVIIMVLTG